MRAPLTVVVDDGAHAHHVTARTTALRFKRSAAGGDIDMTCTLRVPRNTFTNLGPASTATVYDGRTGAMVWTGDTDNPGITDGPAGQTFDLQALGAASRLQDKRVPLAYVLQVDEGWHRSPNSTRGARTDSGQRPDGTSTLEVSWDKDYKVDKFDLGEWVLRSFAQARLQVGRLRCDVDCGIGDNNYVTRLMTGPTTDGVVSADVRYASTTAGAMTAYVGSGIARGDDVVAIRAIYTGADNNPADKHSWFRFWNVIARQVLVNKYGEPDYTADLYSGPGANNVYAHQVIADMIGRGMCPGVDPAKVTIPTLTFPIDSLAWLDGVSMADVMQELVTFEPDLIWQASGDQFTVSLWDPTTPRYVIGRRDGGVSMPGEENTQCNRILVQWTDRKSHDQTIEVRVDVAGLDHIRDADPITLPDNLGSPGNAQRAGERALALKNNPPKAGTAVVRRPILDMWAGAMVLPHEVMPGCTVIDQETGDVLRLTEVEYVDADGAATLTLGEPVRTLEHTLARIERRHRRRRR